MNELKGLIYGHTGTIYNYNVYKEFNERDIRSLILEARSLIPDSFSDKQLLVVNDMFEILKEVEKNSFSIIYIHKDDGMGSSGTHRVVYYKLPVDVAKKYIKLILYNFRGYKRILSELMSYWEDYKFRNFSFRKFLSSIKPYW